jgi:uncharacterized protein (TIRG00374 family)
VSEANPQPAGARPTFARRVFGVAKVALAAGIVAALLARIDRDALVRVLHGAADGWLAAAAVAYSLLLVTQTWKWDRMLRAVGIVRRFRDLLRLYTIGFAFSSFLPGNVGGDVVRWHAASSPGLRSLVGATILGERITGLASLLVMCWLMLAVDHRLVTPPVLILLGSTSAALVGGMWLAWHPRVEALLLRGSRGRAGRLLKPVHSLHGALTSMPAHAIFWSSVYSLPFYAANGLCFMLIARAVGAPITYVEACAVQMVISVLNLLPINVGGLGLTQAGDVYLLGLFGVDSASALGMSLLRLGLRYLYSGIGALLFIGWRGQLGGGELFAGPAPVDAGTAARGDR